MTPGNLPSGRYFTLAWTIPDRIGGLTSAMLQRTRAFVRAGVGEVTVLIFDDRVDYPVVAQRLADRATSSPGKTRRMGVWCCEATGRDHRPQTPVALRHRGRGLPHLRLARRPSRDRRTSASPRVNP